MLYSGPRDVSNFFVFGSVSCRISPPRPITNAMTTLQISLRTSRRRILHGKLHCAVRGIHTVAISVIALGAMATGCGSSSTCTSASCTSGVEVQLPRVSNGRSLTKAKICLGSSCTTFVISKSEGNELFATKMTDVVDLNVTLFAGPKIVSKASHRIVLHPTFPNGRECSPKCRLGSLRVSGTPRRS